MICGSRASTDHTVSQSTQSISILLHTKCQSRRQILEQINKKLKQNIGSVNLLFTGELNVMSTTQMGC